MSMKIIQISNTRRGLKNSSGSFTSGMEKIMVETHEVLLEMGYNSYIVDSLVSSYSGKNIIRLDFDNRISLTKKMIETIKVGKYDVVILHGHNSLAGNLAKENIPFIFIDHQSHESINRLFVRSAYEDNYDKAKSLGSLFVNVSEISTPKKNSKIQKFNPKFEYDHSIKFQYFSPELDRFYDDISDHIIVVGRANPQKRIHKIKEISEYLNIPYKIITQVASVDNEVELEYFDKYLSNDENVLLNIPRELTVEMIGRSRAFVSTCPVESAGIAAFEALCMGVPVLLNESRTYQHASRMFLPKESKYIGNWKTENVSDILNISLEERKILSEFTRKFNSKESFKKSLIELLDDFMFKKSIPLEFTDSNSIF